MSFLVSLMLFAYEKAYSIQRDIPAIRMKASGSMSNTCLLLLQRGSIMLQSLPIMILSGNLPETVGFWPASAQLVCRAKGHSSRPAALCGGADRADCAYWRQPQEHAERRD